MLLLAFCAAIITGETDVRISPDRCPASSCLSPAPTSDGRHAAWRPQDDHDSRPGCVVRPHICGPDMGEHWPRGLRSTRALYPPEGPPRGPAGVPPRSMPPPRPVRAWPRTSLRAGRRTAARLPRRMLAPREPELIPPIWRRSLNASRPVLWARGKTLRSFRGRCCCGWWARANALPPLARAMAAAAGRRPGRWRASFVVSGLAAGVDALPIVRGRWRRGLSSSL